MARPYRIQFEGAISHVSVRGIPRKKMFKDETDFVRVMQMLADAADKHEVTIHSFCATDNQIDLLMETPKGNSSSFLQGFQTAYAQYYRQRYKAKGSLVRDRFRSRIVEAAYLLPMSRLIHMQAVKLGDIKGTIAEKRKALRAYKWSSYRSFVGIGKPLAFVETKSVLKGLKGSGKEARYREYVETGLKENDAALALALKKSQLAVGSDAFVEKIVKDHTRFVNGHKPAHLKVYGQRSGGVAKTKVVDAVCKVLKVEKDLLFQQRKNVLYRPTAAYMLYRHSKMSQNQIASFLKLSSGAAVSLQIRRVRNARDGDDKYRKSLERIERSLVKK